MKFVSVSEHEHWVVGVHGFVFAVTSAEDSAVMRFSSSPSCGISNFSKSTNCSTRSVSVAVSRRAVSEVLTYLEGFVHVNCNASVDVAYAVVVVPPSRAADVTVEESDSSIIARPLPVLRLKMARASYHVEVVDGPGLPVFERTGELAAGNEWTQLSVSQHAIGPFARRRAGFLAS